MDKKKHLKILAAGDIHGDIGLAEKLAEVAYCNLVAGVVLQLTIIIITKRSSSSKSR